MFNITTNPTAAKPAPTMASGTILQIQAAFRKAGGKVPAPGKLEQNKLAISALVSQCIKDGFYPDSNRLAQSYGCSHSLIEEAYKALQKEGKLEEGSTLARIAMKGMKTETETASERFQRERAEKLANDSTRADAPKPKGVLTEVLANWTRRGTPPRVVELLDQTGLPDAILQKSLARLIAEGRTVQILDAYWWIG